MTAPPEVAADTAKIAHLDWTLRCEFGEDGDHEPRQATHLLILDWCGCQAMLCAECADPFDPPECRPGLRWRCHRCESTTAGCPHGVFTVLEL